MTLEQILMEILAELKTISRKLDSNNPDVSAGRAARPASRNIREEVAEQIAAARREAERLKGK